MIFDNEATNNHKLQLLVKVKSAVKFNQQPKQSSKCESFSAFSTLVFKIEKGEKIQMNIYHRSWIECPQLQSCVGKHSHTFTHAHTCSHTHARTRTRTLKLAHTHVHTQAPIPLELSWFKWIYEQNYFTKTPKTQWPEGGANKKCKFFFSSIWIFSRLPPTPWAS